MTPHNKGKKFPDTHPIGMTGKVFTTEQRKKQKENTPKKENHPMWKGGINYNVKYRMSVLEMLGLECVQCGFSDIRALQIDHVNGDGFKERKTERVIGNPYKVMLKKVIEGSKDYQILCANCNWIKKVENKEVPNKKQTI